MSIRRPTVPIVLSLFVILFLITGCSAERVSPYDRSGAHDLTESQRSGRVEDGRFVGLWTYDPTSYAASLRGIFKASFLGSNAYSYEQQGYTEEDARRRAQQNWDTHFGEQEPTDPEPDEEGAASDTPYLLLLADGRAVYANPRRGGAAPTKDDMLGLDPSPAAWDRWLIRVLPFPDEYITTAERQAMSREQRDRRFADRDGLERRAARRLEVAAFGTWEEAEGSPPAVVVRLPMVEGHAGAIRFELHGELLRIVEDEVHEERNADMPLTAFRKAQG